MSATNRTTNYNLPQFVATDVPTWLTDVNGAMSTIDTSIKGVADSVTAVHGEVNAVDARVDTTNGNVTTLAQSVTTAEQNIATLQQGLGVANSNISANSAKIGTDTLDTTAQTLIGAVNEVNNKFEEVLLWSNPSIGSSFSAQTITLDLSEYHEFFIVYQADSTADVVVTVPRKDVRIGASFWTRTALLRRDVTVRDTGVTFTEGWSSGNIETSVTNNNAFRPLAIYGIK